ncbi:MAG: ABC transporter ATP-binding protein [Alphaproteobacteria bacterium]|nr:ABC transporter ATP-binding protein [Alphaproteobacteria bacterium]
MTQSTSSGEAPLCRLAVISHAFGTVQALDHVTLDINAREILAIVGENGAGKSTLMSVLYGLLQPDSGAIEFGGKPMHFRSAADAINHGLGMVHQHFMLYPGLTVLENIVVGAEGRGPFGFIDFAARRQEAQRLVEQFGFSLQLDRPVEDLSVDARQQLEIVKMLYRRADIIILDEPTAVLTPQEIDALFAMLRRLRDEGKSIIMITHKLGEVMDLSDRVVVMRRGKNVAERVTTETDRTELSELMVDGTIEPISKSATIRDETVLSVNSISVSGSHHRTAVDSASLSLQAGEIVGIAGIANNGQTEFVRALVGLSPVSSGSIALRNEDITKTTVKQRRNAGIAYLAEDRMSVGLAVGGTVSENIIAGSENQRKYSNHGFLNFRAIRNHTKELIERFDIRTSGAGQEIGSLSGGNKQKVIVGRELSGDPQLIIAENPCWGVDVGAISFIHQQLLDHAAMGAAILLISSDLDELFALSDRIAVFYDGRISAEFSRDELDIFAVGAAMSGADHDSAAGNAAW